MNQFCVLVASSDSRKDIFDICFANAPRIWADCDWPRYVSFTTFQPDQCGFSTIAHGIDDGRWCDAVADAVNSLPDEIRYILLMVEDTLFLKPVDGKKLNQIASYISNRGLDYVRLVPVTRNWLGRLARETVRLSTTYRVPLELILPNEPYYSSTEMAVWNRDYLLEQLQKPSNAWSFEHHVTDRIHWAVRAPIFDQHQIVHKGRWHRRAPIFLAEAICGYPSYKIALAIEDTLRSSKRPMQSFRSFLRGEWQNINFALFGFTSFRLKRWMGIVKP